MPTSTEIVQSFLDLCATGKSGIQEAVRNYFTPSTVWENVSLATTTGVDEALAFLAASEQAAGTVPQQQGDLLAAAKKATLR